MTDKTGTLTEGHSSFLKPLDVLGAVDDHVLALGLACSDKAGNELDRALWATAAPAQTRRCELGRPRPFAVRSRAPARIRPGRLCRHDLVRAWGPRRTS